MKFDPIKNYDYAFKDMDLEENKHLFNIGEKKVKLLSQLKMDSEFLRENNIIDYSLLICSHKIEFEKKISKQSECKVPATKVVADSPKACSIR